MNHRLAPIACIAILVLSCACAFAQESNAQSAPIVPTARVPRPSPTASAEELVDRAEILHAQKSYLDAVDYYQAALKKENSAITWNKLGITQLQMGRDDDSRHSFERAVKLDKTYPDAVNNVGVTYYKKKKYSRAIKYYKKAIDLRESTASFHSNLAAAYFSKKELSRAMAEYQRAFQLDPTVFERNSKIGVVAQMSSPSDRAQYSYLLAKMFAESGDLNRSLDYLRKAMEDGYPGIGEVYKEKEFAVLRKDPRFNELMASKPLAIPQ
jgi:tetratricopeptide (TPR) repeat protein